MYSRVHGPLRALIFSVAVLSVPTHGYASDFEQVINGQASVGGAVGAPSIQALSAPQAATASEAGHQSPGTSAPSGAPLVGASGNPNPASIVSEEQPNASSTTLGSSRASDLVIRALGLIGVNYRRGGNSPETGLDCSGLVRYVFQGAWGLELPRRAIDISHLGEKIDRQELKPGDLVFYNTLRRAFSHVGIYVGDGNFIHAPSTGGEVRVENMNSPYWRKRFNGARRLGEE